MLTSPYHQACEATIDLLNQPKPKLYIQPVASVEQLQQLWAIDKDAYLDCSLSFEAFKEWWERYEFGSRILLDRDRILASIGIYPLYAEQAAAFISGMIPESDLRPVTMAECEQNRQHNWYASGIVVAEHLRGWNSPLKTLLQLGLTYWLSSGHIAYPLNIWAIAEYEIGARLLNCLGFVKVRDGSTMPDGCDLYNAQFDSEKQIRSMLRAKGL
jgi:hypothetical protein